MDKNQTNEEKDQLYVLSKDLSNLLVANLKNKPYGEVFNMLALLQKNTDGLIKESNINIVINYLSKFPWEQVAGFFEILPTLLEKVVVTDKEPAPASTPSKNPAPKKPIKEVIAETAEVNDESFEDSLGNLDELING